MGTLLHRLIARFKQRLNLSDLHDATDSAFEQCAQVLPAVVRTLKAGEPRVDHAQLWRKELADKLEAIAAEHTRQSQAAQCRRLYLRSTQELGLAGALWEAGNPSMSRMFMDQALASEVPDLMIELWVAKHFMFRLADMSALLWLYRQQFSSTLNYSHFDEAAQEMGKLEAAFALREWAYLQLLHSEDAKQEGWDRFYLDVIQPASRELDEIRQRFEENLCLLSPEKPDLVEFTRFRERQAKAAMTWQSEQGASLKN